jgi:hypothetical protein
LEAGLIATFVADLERLVSQPRFERYRPANRGDLETVVAYLWNVSLSEALLQGISALEIALRNSIHRAFTDHTGTDQWFWAVLKKNDLAVVNAKWVRLAEIQKRPPTSGKVIADLTFGFWPYLFDHRYNDFWRNDGDAMLNAVFPHRPVNVPPHEKVDRARILRRLNLFIDLRNRVMHHEPILNGVAQPDLGNPAPMFPVDVIHAQMIEMLEWIDPQCALALSFVDRFPDVFVNERARIEHRIKTHFSIL